MKALLTLILPILLLTSLTGCGSILATFESNTIEEDPGERSLAQQVEDESIETKAKININEVGRERASARTVSGSLKPCPN